MRKLRNTLLVPMVVLVSVGGLATLGLVHQRSLAAMTELLELRMERQISSTAMGLDLWLFDRRQTASIWARHAGVLSQALIDTESSDTESSDPSEASRSSESNAEIEVQALLRAWVEDDPYYEGFVLLDASGAVHLADRPDSMEFWDATSLPVDANALDDEGLSVGALSGPALASGTLHVLASSHPAAVATETPIEDRAPRLAYALPLVHGAPGQAVQRVGTLVGLIRATMLVELVDSLRFGELGGIYLTDGEGTLLVGSEGRHSPAAEGRQRGDLEVTHVGLVPSTGWFLVEEVAVDEVLAPVHAAARVGLALGLLVVALTCGAMVLLLHRRVLARLARMLDTIRRIDDGDLSARNRDGQDRDGQSHDGEDRDVHGRDGHGDEISEMTAAFDRMADRLHSKVRELADETAERQRTESELHESKGELATRQRELERLSVLIENTSDLVGLASLEGEVIYMNPGGLRMLGLEEMPEGRSIRDFHPEWANRQFQDEAMPAVLEYGTWTGETALLTVSGTEIPVSQVVLGHRGDDAKVEVFATIARDLSDRKGIEEALQGLVSKFRHIIEALPMHFALYQVQGDRVVLTEMNPRLERALKNDRRHYLGMELEDIIAEMLPEHESSELPTLVRRAALQGVPGRGQERYEEAGELHWSLQTYIFQTSPDHAAVLSMDVTEQERAAMDRERLIVQLEAQNAELERFAYTMSHDLRSPLVTIFGFLGFLEQDALAGNAKRVRKDMQVIRNAANTMHKLLDDVLELSRIGRVVNKPEDVPLGELVQRALEELTGSIRTRGVQIDCREDWPVVHGDRQRLFEVWHNLIENAIKFMGKQKAPRIEIGHRLEDGNQIFYVGDNGLGVPADYHEKVFDLFDQLDASSDGTGIGLAIVKRIVELHGGTIWVDSPGDERGSTFQFTLGEVVVE